MIGLEVLTWGTEGQENPYYNPIYHYLWGGSMGHSALKLTLPCNEQTNEWMRLYCREGDEILIPHYQVTRNIMGKDCSQWIVYFSWWPGDLQEEYDDRMSANIEEQVEYTKNWQSYFTETTTQSTGYLRHRFGFLYDMVFGKPKQLPKPISYIVHPSAQQAQLVQDIRELEHKEHVYDEQEKKLQDSLRRISQLDQYSNYLIVKSARQLENCLSEQEKIAIHNELEKQYQKLIEQLDALSLKIEPVLDAHQKLKHELITMRRYICEHAVSVGRQPASVHLSIGNNLSPQAMLKAMHTIKKGPYQFDKFFYNCSTVVREVIERGLSKELQGREGTPHLFDTPLKIHRFALSLQADLIRRNLYNPSKAICVQYSSLSQRQSSEEKPVAVTSSHRASCRLN